MLRPHSGFRWYGRHPLIIRPDRPRCTGRLRDVRSCAGRPYGPLRLGWLLDSHSPLRQLEQRGRKGVMNSLVRPRSSPSLPTSVASRPTGFQVRRIFPPCSCACHPTVQCLRVGCRTAVTHRTLLLRLIGSDDAIGSMGLRARRSFVLKYPLLNQPRRKGAVIRFCLVCRRNLPPTVGQPFCVWTDLYD
jgi:hypothetical protein